MGIRLEYFRNRYKIKQHSTSPLPSIVAANTMNEMNLREKFSDVIAIYVNDVTRIFVYIDSSNEIYSSELANVNENIFFYALTIAELYWHRYSLSTQSKETFERLAFNLPYTYLRSRINSPAYSR